MEKGSNSNRQVTQSTPREVVYIPTFTVVPSTTASYGRSSNAQGYQMTSKVNHEDKATGSYARYTAKEEVSSGELYRGRGSRQYGVKDEVKSSSTYKVGDKSGCTEYYKEERVRNVGYGNSSSKRYNYGGGSSNSVANNNYSYGGSGCDYDYDSDDY